MRPVQIHLLAFWKIVDRDLTKFISVTSHLKSHLQWWLKPENMLKGQDLKPKKHSQILTTDASISGWGAHLGQMQVAGTWSENLQKQHINYLEMMAVFLGLKHFLKHLENKVVLVKTDNTTVMCYINKQGGGDSIPKSVHFDLEYVSVGNKTQDSLDSATRIGSEQSRGSKIKNTEWTLKKSVVQTIFQMWEIPHVDLFATRLNHQIQTFVSPFPDELALTVDALSISWKGVIGYAYPPIVLIPKVLQKIQEGGCKIILIAPFWTRQPWFPILTQLLVDYPVRLPEISDLISQPRSRLYHQNVSMLKLTAWRLSADSWLRKAFLDQCRKEQHRVGEQVPTVHTTIDSESFLTGPDENILIRCRHLNHR